MRDYTSITELPGSLLTGEQMARFRHRYTVALHLTRGVRLLEVACGAGIGLALWRDHSSIGAVGLDITQGVLTQAQQALGGSAPLVCGSAEALPFASSSFDTILCFEAIYYLSNPARFLTEARRLLSTDGQLLLCQTNPSAPGFVPGHHTTHYPDAPALAAASRAAGFRTVHLYGTFPQAQATLRGQVRHQARRWAHSSGLVPTRGPIADRLKRAAYGTLEPLPALLPPPDAAERAAALAALAPLDAARPDPLHRVLYLHAQV